MTAADVKAYILYMLETAAKTHAREARYLPIVSAEKRECATYAVSVLRDQVKALIENHPAFEEMASMCKRTACRCQRKDENFFNRLDYTATGYEMTLKMLEAMLINYR